jgi:hypothetical protein
LEKIEAEQDAKKAEWKAKMARGELKRRSGLARLFLGPHPDEIPPTPEIIELAAVFLAPKIVKAAGYECPLCRNTFRCNACEGTGDCKPCGGTGWV